MNAILLKIWPVLVIALLGYFLKLLKVLKQTDGDVLLRVVFFFALPALILKSIPKVELEIEMVFLPLSSAIIIFTIYLLASALGKSLDLNRKQLGVFIIASVIINNGFLIPFIVAAFGEEGLGRLLLFDLANAILVYTFVYLLACRYGENHHSKKVLTRKLLFSPPVWALLIAILVNVSGWEYHDALASFFTYAGDMTIPLLLLSLGIFFNPKVVKIKAMSWAILVRMGGGLALGFLLAWIFQLEGLNRIIVIICSAAPVGYNTLTFSSLEKLDKEFAASLVSFSILIGMILTPILIYLLS